MKPFFNFCAAILLVCTANAQTVQPVAKSFGAGNKSRELAAQFGLSLRERAELMRVVDSAVGTMKIGVFTIQDTKESRDSVYKAWEAAEIRERMQKVVDSLNETSPVLPVATGGISNLENLKQTYGSLSVGLQFRLTNYKLTKRNWIDPHFITIFFSTKTATSPDSTSLQKTFMFPELNKRDFAIGYRWEHIKNGWSFAPAFEFSFNRFSDTSLKKNFVSQSYILGLRIQKAFASTPVSSYLSFFPYYSVTAVDKKYTNDYHKLIGEDIIPRVFHSLGLNVSVQTNNSILFCNMKYVLNRGDKIVSPELKTFIYTIGTLLAL